MTREAATLVLAAGKGERIGGPKALLVVDDAPLAIVHARTRLAAESERVVIVVRAPVAELLAPLAARHPGTRLVISTEPDEDGPAGSLRAAVASKALGSAAKILVTPVDVLPASESLTRALLDALGEPGIVAARPRRGHPVALRRDLLEINYPPTTSSSPPKPLRVVLSALGAACKTIPEDGLPSIDEPHDAERQLSSPPRFWSPA
jgi:CTP:molybdopterin cytidylyltransferase MocA